MIFRSSGNVSASSPALSIVSTGPSTNEALIRYDLPDARDLTLTIHDLHGRLVETLASGPQSAGPHTTPRAGPQRAVHSNVTVT